MFLTDDELKELDFHTKRWGRNLMWLADHSVRSGKLAWHITFKCHVAQHLPFQAEVLNPRFTQNYADESMVGRMSRMFFAAANGPSDQEVLQYSVLRKYIISTRLRFAGYV